MTTVTGEPLIASARPAAAPAAPEPVPGPLPQLAAVMRTWAGERFGMDYRSLALLRIGIGALLMWVTWTHGINARIFYSDVGVMPRSTFLGGTEQYPGFSLYFAHGSPVVIAGLFILQFLFAFMMTIGYRTRLATIASYIMLLSMQNRHPVLLFGGDIVQKVTLFWAMFLPLAERYSIDRLVGRTKRPTQRPYLGLAAIAYFIQFASIYVLTSLIKTGPTWRVDHTAVSFALALDVYSRPLGHWLYQFPTLTRYLTISTIYLEFYGPYLFIFPLFNKWTRLLGFVIFGGLQLGFGMCMFLGTFGVTMTVIMLAFLPAIFWDRMAEPLGRWLARRLGGACRWAGAHLSGVVALWGRWVERERRRCATLPILPRWLAIASRWSWVFVRDGAVVSLVWLTLLWNAGTVPGQGPKLSESTNRFIYTIGLDQFWNMFAPDPEDIDGWFVVQGTKWNGQTVDLMTGASPATFDKPAYVAGTYRDRLWMSYLISFWTDGASDQEAFAKYMGTQWNQQHTGDDRLETVQIYEMLEWVRIGDDKQPQKTEPESQLLWTEWFYR